MHSVMFRTFAGLALLVASLAATPASAHEVKLGALSVINPWSRATLGTGRPGVAYFTIRNDGAAADELIGATTPIARKVMIHRTTMEDGVMKMAPVGAVTIPSHGTVVFKPGSYHVMLMGLTRPLAKGDTFPLTLSFRTAGTVDVTVVVGAAGAMGTDHDGMKGHMNMDGLKTE